MMSYTQGLSRLRERKVLKEGPGQGIIGACWEYSTAVSRVYVREEVANFTPLLPSSRKS